MKSLTVLICVLLICLPTTISATCVRVQEEGPGKDYVSCLSDEEEFKLYIVHKDVIASGAVLEVKTWHDLSPKMDEIRFAVAEGVKGAADGDTMTFWVNRGLLIEPQDSGLSKGDECLVFLKKDKFSGLLAIGSVYRDKYEASDECIALVESVVERDKRYNIYDRCELVVHGIVIGSTRVEGGAHHHHDPFHECDHAIHEDEHKHHIWEALGEIPKVWPNCEHEPEGVLIQVKEALKGTAADTIKLAIQRVYIGVYPKFEEGQEVMVFLEPLADGFYELAGYKPSKVLLRDGKVVGRDETPEEFLTRIAARPK